MVARLQGYKATKLQGLKVSRLLGHSAQREEHGAQGMEFSVLPFPISVLPTLLSRFPLRPKACLLAARQEWPARNRVFRRLSS